MITFGLIEMSITTRFPMIFDEVYASGTSPTPAGRHPLNNSGNIVLIDRDIQILNSYNTYTPCGAVPCEHGSEGTRGVMDGVAQRGTGLQTIGYEYTATRGVFAQHIHRVM